MLVVVLCMTNICITNSPLLVVTNMTTVGRYVIGLEQAEAQERCGQRRAEN